MTMKDFAELKEHCIATMKMEEMFSEIVLVCGKCGTYISSYICTFTSLLSTEGQ